MIKVFHYDRSTACQRVRLLLEEKQLEWESVIVDTARGDIDDLPENYYTLNPKGLTPVIIHEGKAIPESVVILEYLEDKFPTPSFRPDSSEDKADMRLWMKKIDDGIHVASRTIGVCLVNRHIYEEKDPELIKKYYDKMKDDVRKNNDQINIEYGLESPLLPNAIAQFKKLFTEMDNHLKTHKWLVNDNYSLADIAVVGGGYGKGIHNVLEPAAFGVPMITGPKINRFREAVLLKQHSALHTAATPLALTKKLKALLAPDNTQQLKRSGDAALSFVTDQTGSAEKISSYLP